jgi:hypothetical protein
MRTTGTPAAATDGSSAGVDGSTGHLRAHGVDAHHDPRTSQGLDDRKHPVQLLVKVDPSRTGARGLTTDVNQVRACVDELTAVRDRPIWIEPLAAVGERVRRDVEDSHDRAPVELREAGHDEPVAHVSHR